jgi:tryptophan 7-halogenase
MQIRKVILVGGGTAGWLSACHLAKKLQSHKEEGVEVCLIESADIPSIGVGEGTVPAIRNSLEYFGISETEFVRECDATFKQSIKFIDWLETPGATNAGHYYHHVFDYPDIAPLDLTAYWLLDHQKSLPFVDAVSIQGRLCDLDLGPKNMTHPEFQGLANYAYHLDAAKFAQVLTRHATQKLGVKHIRANLLSVELNEQGEISALHTDQGIFSADFYVDCTGFASLLLGDALQIPFISKNHQLFADHAVVAQVAYEQHDAPIPCSTLASAKEAGWIWDIGLFARRGTGYVYSSAHTSHARAEQVLRDYLNDNQQLQLRRIPMKVGYREKFWHKNCVAIGLSQGFVEPLEATGLLVYDATARMLAEQFPASTEHMESVAKKFNKTVKNAWDKVIDFVKLHYLYRGEMIRIFG